MKKRVKTDVWNIASLETELNEAIMSSTLLIAPPFWLQAGTTITDIHLFVESHLTTIKHNNGNPVFASYFDRLVKFKNMITK